MSFAKKVWIIILAIIGILTTIKLSVIYYDANFNPYALASFCSISEFIDCDNVAKTTYSVFLGIPLSFWGMFLYLVIILLTVAENLKKFKLLRFLEVFKTPAAYICLLGVVSFTISMILAGISIFEIKKICILCFFTYILDLVIAIVAFSRQNIFKIAFDDFMSAIKIKKYAISFIIVVFLGIGALAYTSTSYVFAPQVKKINSIKSFMEMKENPFKADGNILGDKGASIMIDVYSDYRCPMCYSSNLMLHRLAKEVSGVVIYHHNFPLDVKCNKYLKQPFHEDACMLASYSIAAEKQGKYWNFNSALFEKQPENEDEVIKLAQKIGLDKHKLKIDAHSPQVQQQLKDEIDMGANLGVEGTPALFLNGKTYKGVMPYYELKELVLKAGAVERK